MVFLFPWCVVSIGIHRYWQGSIRSRGLRNHVIMYSLGQRIPCASIQVCCNCLWMPRCVTHVPVVGWSCIWLLTMLVIPRGSTQVSHATLKELSITMIGHCRCIPQFYIHRRLTIVLLMVWQRLCCWLVPPWWWHVGGISSIVRDLGDSIVGAVVVPIVSLSSVSGVAGLRSILLVGVDGNYQLITQFSP